MLYLRTLQLAQLPADSRTTSSMIKVIKSGNDQALMKPRVPRIDMTVYHFCFRVFKELLSPLFETVCDESIATRYVTRRGALALRLDCCRLLPPRSYRSHSHRKYSPSWQRRIAHDNAFKCQPSTEFPRSPHRLRSILKIGSVGKFYHGVLQCRSSSANSKYLLVVSTPRH